MELKESDEIECVFEDNKIINLINKNARSLDSDLIIKYLDDSFCLGYMIFGLEGD